MTEIKPCPCGDMPNETHTRNSVEWKCTSGKHHVIVASLNGKPRGYMEELIYQWNKRK